MPITGNEIRKTLLSVVAEHQRLSGGSAIAASLQQNSILNEASQQLGRLTHDEEQALLTVWYDLFRSGQLAWGYNLNNPDPPFCHLTTQGRRTLQFLSRDPANPDGYVAHLKKLAKVNAVALSYIDEALQTYAANCFRATAVMVGAAAESVALELRDVVVDGIKNTGRTSPKDLNDWRIKRVLDALQKELEMQRQGMPAGLSESFEAYWPAFIQQIRAARNEAGHPASIDPVTPETVHAALLIFPEVAALTTQLTTWAKGHYK